MESEINGDSDLKIREPTPDYDTTSMASTIIPADSRLSAKVKQSSRRNSSDSAAGSSGNGKRRHEGARSTSSSGSNKDLSSSNKQQKYNQLDAKNRSKEKNDIGEQGKATFVIAVKPSDIQRGFIVITRDSSCSLSCTDDFTIQHNPNYVS